MRQACPQDNLTRQPATPTGASSASGRFATLPDALEREKTSPLGTDPERARWRIILATTYSPTALRRSTIGAGGLNGRVRNGIGCFSSANAARNNENAGSAKAVLSSEACRDEVPRSFTPRCIADRRSAIRKKAVIFPRCAIHLYCSATGRM